MPRRNSIKFPAKSAGKFAASLLCLAQLTVPSAFAGGGIGTPSDAPIDIQANEQEFAGNEVIAKGNVRVTYKDSVVVGPMAQLFRGPDGQPQKAIFTGHPHLTQGRNRIHADTLVFEIATGQVIADGHAHSEVNPSAQDDATADADNGQDMEGAPPKGQKGKVAKASETDLLDGTVPDTTAKKSKIKPSHAQSPEMMITDADHQEYFKDGGKFEARGHVRVKTQDIVVKADKLNLVYGLDNKPETAVFTGNVDATQFDNNTKADLMTYFMSTQRLQATGNVKSRVIQRKADDPKKGGLTAPKGDEVAIDAAALGDTPEDQIILINSDAQDYTKETGRIAAQGNVRIKCGEITGYGPHVVVVRNEEGQAEKVLFTGRSQINQPGKRWIGDRITFNVLDKKVLAEGNTRAIIVQNPGKKPDAAPQTAAAGTATGAAPAKAPAGGKPAGGAPGRAPSKSPDDAKLAGKNKISTKFVQDDTEEVPQ